MSHAATVIDFTLYRKRKLAQQQGRLLWAFYMQQAGVAAQAARTGTAIPNAPRQA
ncbi:hypothetical protein [Pseudomonas juntendi]|uniref:Uncharacterized protein n=1 Tax=Pseudomonas juntendi TaxID=2666183 RepID=A0A7W2JHU7_9PSED|nr:hypothetical protein [Pseudomonas juntendi]MBA6059273.1 hypothetical protein [Pseudomonas juntendi]MBA6126377.1 hypothetical protein [Pseudomonas juntendi]